MMLYGAQMKSAISWFDNSAHCDNIMLFVTKKIILKNLKKETKGGILVFSTSQQTSLCHKKKILTCSNKYLFHNNFKKEGTVRGSFFL